jgi:hypothetical protein
MNISITESTEIVTQLIEEDNADSQTSCETYAGATSLAGVLNISKSVVIKICLLERNVGFSLLLQLQFETFSLAIHI